jgi:endonuclease YncB( thermonuclease family)
MNDLLEKCIPSEIKRFSINGTYRAKVCKVYDGDTCTCIFEYSDNKLYKFSVRLSEIDTPEIKSQNADEREKAVKARDYLRSRILDKIVSLECDGFDKYGRILGKIYIEDTCINQEMIQKEYARVYGK